MSPRMMVWIGRSIQDDQSLRVTNAAPASQLRTMGSTATWRVLRVEQKGNG